MLGETVPTAIDGSDNLLVRHIKSAGDGLTRDVFARLLEEADVTEEQRGRLRAIYDTPFDLLPAPGRDTPLVVPARNGS